MNGACTLRAELLARRIRQSPAEQLACGEVIQRTLIGLDAYIAADSIALYMPVHGEVPTGDLMNNALAAGKTVYLPALEREQIILRQYCSGEVLIKGRYGILEPSASALIVDPGNVDVFVVPGIGFDLYGNRLGYGKGFYDRLLVSRSVFSKRIGICFDCQLVEKLEVKLHDVSMDMVITERRVISSTC